jgi:hypothetical protein
MGKSGREVTEGGGGSFIGLGVPFLCGGPSLSRSEVELDRFQFGWCLILVLKLEITSS